jgi:hypothetical protein
MKINIFFALLLFSAVGYAQEFKYKIVTTVESVVPGGLGRSRIIENGAEVDYT